MTSLEAVCTWLAQVAPLRLAESWDNVGLLVGDRKASLSRVMTCLTITSDVVDEAIDENVNLIVTHHPLPFKELRRITTDTVAGSLLWNLIGKQVAIYSAHTAFDSAEDGINQKWTKALGLQSTESLIPGDDPIRPSEGAGRMGRLSKPITLEAMIREAAESVGAVGARRVGAADKPVQKIGFACGSGGTFLAAAKRRGCDALITGEASFHTCLEAEAMGIGLGLLGHYWSERFAMEELSQQMADEFSGLDVWPSRRESDPIQTV